PVSDYLVASRAADALEVEGEASMTQQVVLVHLDTLLLKVGDEAGIVGVAEQDDLGSRESQLFRVGARAEAMFGAAEFRVETSSWLRSVGFLARGRSTGTLRFVVSLDPCSAALPAPMSFYVCITEG